MINFFSKDRKVLVADSNKEHKNGYTFSIDALKSMYESIKTDKIVGQLGSVKDDGGVVIDRATHQCHSPELKDGKLYCKINFLETPYVEEALGYLRENSFELFTFKPEGTFETDPATNTIYNYELNSINLFIESEQ